MQHHQTATICNGLKKKKDTYVLMSYNSLFKKFIDFPPPLLNLFTSTSSIHVYTLKIITTRY